MLRKAFPLLRSGFLVLSLVVVVTISWEQQQTIDLVSWLVSNKLMMEIL